MVFSKILKRISICICIHAEKRFDLEQRTLAVRAELLPFALHRISKQNVTFDTESSS